MGEAAYGSVLATWMGCGPIALILRVRTADIANH